jgi:EAL domain-containing protein (putative c-di-GMP-specific phosphodiesterase class I)
MMPPSAFVPLAERAGLVTQLGRFVLGETVRQWREWSDRGLDLDVSVNLTTADLLDLSLPDSVLRLLEQHAMPPARLVLEITESTLMGDERRTLDVLGRLRSVGVRIAIDALGTGYSSRGYLSRLPVDEVKIDRSFVSGLPADAGSSSIVRLTVELARTFGLCVVAEGVETAEQLEHLAGLGCDVAQGYLVGRPVPAAALAQRLAPARAGRGRAGRPGALAT